MYEERIAQLADYIATLDLVGFDFFGYSIPEDLHNELSDCRDRYGDLNRKKVFKRLFDLNAAAFAGRYDEDQEPAPDMPEFSRLPRCREAGSDESIRGWYEAIKPWHYELLKLTECFLYQCDEDATRENPLYKALLQLVPLQQSHIISNTPEYIKAQWG